MDILRLKEAFVALLPLVLLLFVTAATVAAQAQPITRTVSADEVNLVARELWCPLCSGVRLDACELQACEQMREEIAIKLEAGEDIASIKQYFLTRYGEQVLGAPPREGWGWLAWLLPPAVIIVAGVTLFMWGRQWIKPTASRSIMTTLTQQSVNVPTDKSKESAPDPYEKKLDEELNRYE